MSGSALETHSTAWAQETMRRREQLTLLRDHLEQLLCTLLRAMPRTDVETLLAGCGSRELIRFGTEAVAAAVVTALLRDPDRWSSAREAIRRGSRRGHERSGDPAAREEAAVLTEALLARLDFGLDIHRRGRSALDSALEQARDGPAPAETRGIPRSPDRPPTPDATRGTR